MVPSVTGPRASFPSIRLFRRPANFPTVSNYMPAVSGFPLLHGEEEEEEEGVSLGMHRDSHRTEEF